MIKNFTEIVNQVKSEKQRTIAGAMAEDKEVITAIEKARSLGLAKALLTGDAERIESVLYELNINKNEYKIEPAENEQHAVELAIESVRNEKAQVLMKGLCSTSVFLKAILNKKNEMRSSSVISHLALFESPYYHKLLLMSDAAMNIAPDLKTKIAITENAIKVTCKLGYSNPKLALISAIEKVNPEGIPSTVDAAIISKMADRGQIKNAIIDGPLAVDNALSQQSCEVKGLKSPVGGDADICIVPNIETGNVFYKLLTILGNAKVAGIIVGAKVPVVLTSRADSDESKFLSIITALKIG